MLVCGDGMVIRQTLKPLFTITGPSSRALGKQKFSDIFLLIFSWESGIHVVCNAPENSKTERGGLNFVDPEK